MSILAEPDARVGGGVEDVGEDEGGEIQERAEVGAGEDDGFVGGLDAEDHDVADAGDAEEALDEQRAHDQFRELADGERDERDEPVF